MDNPFIPLTVIWSWCRHQRLFFPLFLNPGLCEGMATTDTPWHAAYPAPKSKAASLSRQELLQWFRDGKQAGKDFILIDVRRTDYEVRRILPGPRKSINFLSTNT